MKKGALKNSLSKKVGNSPELGKSMKKKKNQGQMENMDLVDHQTQFYQPMQLADYENMVEFSDDGTTSPLENPYEQKTKQ